MRHPAVDAFFVCRVWAFSKGRLFSCPRIFNYLYPYTCSGLSLFSANYPLPRSVFLFSADHLIYFIQIINSSPSDTLGSTLNSSFFTLFRPQFWKILSRSRQFSSVYWCCSIFIQLKSFRIERKRVFGFVFVFGWNNETKRKTLEVLHTPNGKFVNLIFIKHVYALAFNQYIVTEMDNESVNFAIDAANSVLFQIVTDNNCYKVVRYGHKKR